MPIPTCLLNSLPSYHRHCTKPPTISYVRALRFLWRALSRRFKVRPHGCPPAWKDDYMSQFSGWRGDKELFIRRRRGATPQYHHASALVHRIYLPLQSSWMFWRNLRCRMRLAWHTRRCFYQCVVSNLYFILGVRLKHGCIEPRLGSCSWATMDLEGEELHFFVSQIIYFYYVYTNSPLVFSWIADSFNVNTCALISHVL